MHIVLPAVGFGLITASVLALAAVGFTMQFSVTNVLNLAYGDIMTGAAFVAYLFMRIVPNLWLALLFTGLVTGVASVLLNRYLYMRFVRRGTRLFAMIVLTIAVGLILQNAMLAVAGAQFYTLPAGNGRSYRFAGMIFTLEQLVIIAIAVAAMVAVHLVLRRTRLGKAMRATATEPDLARNCGISTDRIIDAAWFISGILCGLAGVALVMNITSFSTVTGSQFLVPVIAAAVLGGVGHPYGAMLGALVIGLVSEISAAFIDPNYKDVVAFAILVIVLLLRPQGIFTEVATAKEVVA